MRRLIRPLRVRLAITGFLTAYAPTLVLLIAAFLVSGNVDTSVSTGAGGEAIETTVERSGVPVSVVVIVAIAFAPFAAAFAWWWSGRALRPMAEAIGLQERLMEETSHELRTPLAVLSNNAQVLLAHPEPTIEVYREGLARSEAVARRMSETIDSLLVDARGRARTIDRVPADLAEVAASVVESVQPLAAERAVTIRLRTPGPVEAAIDRASVTRAVANLVTNAVQHGPADSTVDVEVGRDGGHAFVVVTDEGPGIDPADQERIFERYWQSEASDGSGIGLAIVAQVAAAHGGEVTVASPLGDRAGSRFRLTLAV